MNNDLISRSALKKAIKSYADDQYAENEYLGECAIMDIIDNAPTFSNDFIKAMEEGTDDYDFCPNCSADMREKLMRMIDADELRKQFSSDGPYGPEEIRNIIDNAPTVPLPDFKEGYKQAILDGKTSHYTILFNSKPKGEWIPVSERLPEERGMYLVTEKIFEFDDINHRGKFKIETAQVEFRNGKWNRAIFFEVIAWQPLPEPYKEEGEEQ